MQAASAGQAQVRASATNLGGILPNPIIQRGLHLAPSGVALRSPLLPPGPLLRLAPRDLVPQRPVGHLNGLRHLEVVRPLQGLPSLPLLILDRGDGDLDRVPRREVGG